MAADDDLNFLCGADAPAVTPTIRSWGRVETLAREAGVAPEDLLTVYDDLRLRRMKIKDLRALLVNLKKELESR